MRGIEVTLIGSEAPQIPAGTSVMGIPMTGLDVFHLGPQTAHPLRTRLSNSLATCRAWLAGDENAIDKGSSVLLLRGLNSVSPDGCIGLHRRRVCLANRIMAGCISGFGGRSINGFRTISSAPVASRPSADRATDAKT